MEEDRRVAVILALCVAAGHQVALLAGRRAVWGDLGTLRGMRASDDPKHVMELQALLTWKLEDPGAESGMSPKFWLGEVPVSPREHRFG